MKSILFILALLLLSCGREVKHKENYSFFVAGHVYGKPGINNTGVHPPFKKQFPFIKNHRNMKFGVFTGDIVRPKPIEEDWNEIDADVRELGLPVHFAVGNHDMENRELYESRYEKTYYSFLNGGDLFLILDPNLDHWNISGDQLDFVHEVVNKNADSVNNVFVFFHQILWNSSEKKIKITPNSSAGRSKKINFWTEVEPIFHKLPNQIYFIAGDVGAAKWSSDYSYDKYDNIHLISSGMGEGKGDNYLIVDVEKGIAKVNKKNIED